MTVSARYRSFAVALLSLFAMAASACAEPVIPVVTAAPTAVPTPTPTPVPEAGEPAPPPERPSDGEPGLTDEVMRIGVLVDATFPTVAGQNTMAAAEAVQAWAASINPNGGLSGRQVQVVVIDTQLSDHGAAVDLACRSDLFALVGSAALFDAAGLDQLVSSTCSLPDFPAMVNTRARLDSGLTFLSNPLVDDVMNAGWAAFRSREFPESVVRSGTLLLDFPVTIINGERTIEAGLSRGYEWQYTPALDAFADDFSPYAAEIADGDVRSLTWGADGTRLIGLLEALEEAEVDLDFIDCGQVCYSADWVEAAGTAGNGVSVWLPTLPFEEPDVGSEVFNYLFWLGTAQSENASTGDQVSAPSETGLAAWASALLFEEAVNRAVGAGTSDYDPSVLTRDATIAAARTITNWDAKGLHGPTNPAEGVPSPCFVIMTLNDGAWERTYPAEVGEMDCSSANLFTVESSADLESPGGEPTGGTDTDGGDDEVPTDGGESVPDEGTDEPDDEQQIPTPDADDG